MSVEVVAALVWKKGRFLICRRPANKKRGTLWEFPGGKIEPGEDGKTALARELREELDIGVSVGEVFCDVTHEYPDITVHLTLYYTEITEGRPKLLEHSELRWIRTDEIPRFDFCPADTEILAKLTCMAEGLTILDFGQQAAMLMPAKNPDGRILYLHEHLETGFELRRLLPENAPDIVLIENTDWNAELSPWQAEKVFRGGSDFSGGGPEYLRVLSSTIIPQAEKVLGHDLDRRGIGGYSLAGLFALWSACETDLFSYAAVMSGSLWFDGFVDYIREHGPSGSLNKVFFSLGEREKNSKNERMRRVETATEDVVSLLKGNGIDVSFTLNPGGHFNDIMSRIIAGITSF